MLFRLNTAVLTAVVVAVIVGATLAGIAVGRRLSAHRENWKEGVGATQAALLGFIGLLLAFGLTMAVSRYESRRLATVAEANAIGTTWLRAQLLNEPTRTDALVLLKGYTDARLVLARAREGSRDSFAAERDSARIQAELWRTVAQAIEAEPVGTAGRLYTETVNEVINTDTARVAELENRVPASVIYLQILGSAVGLGLLGLYLAMLGRTVTIAMIAALTVSVIVLVTLDLDRPVRGFITVPDAALVTLRASMDAPPAVP